MISVYGLNDKIGNVSYYDSSGQSDYSFSKPCEKTLKLSTRVKELISSAYKSIDCFWNTAARCSWLSAWGSEVLYREDLGRNSSAFHCL